MGANTAMAGYGLSEAIGALRRLGFPTTEIHPMGVPEATAKVYLFRGRQELYRILEKEGGYGS